MSLVLRCQKRQFLETKLLMRFTLTGCPHSTRFRVPRMLALAMASVTWLGASQAQAQSIRTYVSGTGKDGNPCTVGLPCQSLETALGRTLPGGQINILDSANYGTLTVTRAVSIVGGHGAAGVQAP